MIVELSLSEMVLLEMRTTSAWQDDPLDVGPKVAHYLSRLVVVCQFNIDMGMVKAAKDAVAPLNPVLVVQEYGDVLVQEERYFDSLPNLIHMTTS